MNENINNEETQVVLPEDTAPEMPIDFEAARAQAAAMLTDDETADAVEEDAVIPPEETNEPAVEQPNAEGQPAAESTVTETPVQQNANFDALMEQYRQLAAENQRLAAALEQQSEQVQETALDNAVQPDIDIAHLRDQILYGGEEESQAGLGKLVEQASLAGYAKAMQEIKPMLEQYKAVATEREYDDAFATLSEVPFMSGISDIKDDLRQIGDKFFNDSNLSATERMARAYFYKRGLDSVNTPPAAPREFTQEDALKMYRENPELRKAIEAERYNTAKSASEAAPVLKSGGMANAAPTMPRTPQTIEEAGQMAREAWRNGRL